MAIMKKRAVLAVTVGVWLAAIGSAAALTYDLNRPLHPERSASSGEAAAESTPSEVPPPLVQAKAPPLQMMPTFTIVGHVPARAPVHPVRVPDISKMHCSEWRHLDMGSGNVQECE